MGVLVLPSVVTARPGAAPPMIATDGLDGISRPEPVVLPGGPPDVIRVQPPASDHENRSTLNMARYRSPRRSISTAPTPLGAVLRLISVSDPELPLSNVAMKPSTATTIRLGKPALDAICGCEAKGVVPETAGAPSPNGLAPAASAGVKPGSEPSWGGRANQTWMSASEKSGSLLQSVDPRVRMNVR